MGKQLTEKQFNGLMKKKKEKICIRKKRGAAG